MLCQSIQFTHSWKFLMKKFSLGIKTRRVSPQLLKALNYPTDFRLSSCLSSFDEWMNGCLCELECFCFWTWKTNESFFPTQVDDTRLLTEVKCTANQGNDAKYTTSWRAKRIGTKRRWVFPVFLYELFNDRLECSQLRQRRRRDRSKVKKAAHFKWTKNSTEYQ